MIKDVKIINQVLDNQTEHIKRTTYHNEMRFIQGKQSWFNIQKAMNITHYCQQTKDENSRDLINTCKKTI